MAEQTRLGVLTPAYTPLHDGVITPTAPEGTMNTSTGNLLDGTLIELIEAEEAINVRASKVGLQLVYVDVVQSDCEDSPAWEYLHGLVLDGPQARALIRALKSACEDVEVTVSDL